LIKTKNITAILAHLLPITIAMTFQEVAVEAWMITILGKDRQKGGFAVWIGTGAGWWTGYPLFSCLHGKNIMNSRMFLQCLAFYIVINTIVIILFVAEEKMEPFFKNCNDIKETSKKILSNGMFKLWIKWGI